MKYSLFILSLIGLIACNEKPPVSESESSTKTYFENQETGVKDGGIQIIPINTMGKTFNVWTKRIGNNPKIKVLLLNGGPGCTHEYFECFESFLPAEGIEFIYYDQLGTGHSDNPNDTAYWDLQRYVDEVEQVRIALGLDKDNCFLLGHSWGGILALEYALQHQDKLKGLIISNMMCSCPDYGKYADEVLAKQMDPALLDSIRAMEAANDFSNPRYMGILMPHFYQQHICRIPIEEWPEPVNRSFAQINQSLYVTMQGPSEFGIAGRLTEWDRKDRLKEIKIPTLTIGATHDTMDPEHMKWMSTQVQKGTYAHCPNGSHMCFYDDQENYFKGLLGFLKNYE
jgi:proline iminopeptidase